VVIWGDSFTKPSEVSVERMNLQTVLISLVITSLYLLLAIWGWGDLRGFFSHPARTGLAFVTIALAVAACFSQSSGFSSGRREMTSNRWVVFALIILALAIGWLAPHADRRNWWTIDGDAARYTGLALYFLGGVVRLIPVFELKNRFSAFVAVQEGHKLKTDGMYRVVRHPSYAGLLITTIGWCLVFRSSIGLLLTLGILVTIVGRIRAEERFLHEEFGEEYNAYRRQTRWRLLPFVY
jgi:protein-S-isoprenylcysteine O-methyltransferase Ste14